MKKLLPLINIAFLICSLCGTTAISQTKKVVVLDSVQSKSALIDLANCDYNKVELKQTKELLNGNYLIIDKQNTIIINENSQKLKEISKGKEKDSINTIQKQTITDLKHTLKKINTPKNIYKFGFYAALATIGKLILFK